MDDNETKDKIETNKKCPDTKKVISLFNSYVDENTIYSLDEYKKMLSISYKEANKKQKYLMEEKELEEQRGLNVKFVLKESLLNIIFLLEKKCQDLKKQIMKFLIKSL
jgi:hypothetical protein